MLNEKKREFLAKRKLNSISHYKGELKSHIIGEHGNNRRSVFSVECLAWSDFIEHKKKKKKKKFFPVDIESIFLFSYLTFQRASFKIEFPPFQNVIQTRSLLATMEPVFQPLTNVTNSKIAKKEKMKSSAVSEPSNLTISIALSHLCPKNLALALATVTLKAILLLM